MCEFTIQERQQTLDGGTAETQTTFDGDLVEEGEER